MSGAGAISPWIVFPPALALMFLFAWHMVATGASVAPESRKRIRIANGWVMLLTIPLVAAGFSLVSADRQPRAFLLIWGAAIVLIFLTVALALADVVNTIRLARRAGDSLHQELRDNLRTDRAQRAGTTQRGGSASAR